MTSPVSATHFPRCPMCLLWKADLRLQPSWQMSTVQDPRKTWLATGSLLTVWWKMQSLGEDCSSPLPSGSGCHTAASPALGREGPKQQLACSPCSLGHNPLFCEHARGHHMALEPFVGKVLFFFFVSLAIPRFGLLCLINCLRLSSGHSGLVLTLRTDESAYASLPRPHSLLPDVNF